MPDNTSVWSSVAENAPADEALFEVFEDEFGVRLPDSFKEMYRIQNGGSLQDVEWPDYLLPIGASTGFFERICSLQMWAEAGAMLTADDLDWIEEDCGDPSLVFPLSSDGHTTYALNYNQTDANSEPSVIYVDFECCSDERVPHETSKAVQKEPRFVPGAGRLALARDEANLCPVAFARR